LPAVGSFPGQVGFFDPAYIPVALDFIADKTEELNLPSVTLMNLGSIGGPTDGSSDICQAMDAFVQAGRILVCGVGDDGGADNRASGSYELGDTLDIVIEKGAIGNLRFECWYPDADRFSVQIVYPNGTETPVYPGPATNQAAADQFPNSVALYHRGADQEFYSASSPTRMIMADFSGATGTYIMRLICTQRSATGDFSASLNPATYANTNRFTTYVQGNGSINDYASAMRVITPTDYVYQNTWTDIDGAARGITGQGDPGEIWIGSSSGPTLDGRLGVDVAVPGEVIFTSYSAGTYYSQFRFNMIQGGQEVYGLQNAVSACAPFLTGVIALMLEINPDLEPEEARDLLRNYAREDAFTGATPNTTWGHGKLDVKATIDATWATVSIDGQLAEQGGWDIGPVPANSVLFYKWKGGSAPVEHVSATFYGMDGRKVWGQEQMPSGEGALDLQTVSAGLYILKLAAGPSVQSHLILVQ
ncbi:MAG: S8 family peptidase, partial [Bacteroidota bacterium]